MRLVTLALLMLALAACNHTVSSANLKAALAACEPNGGVYSIVVSEEHRTVYAHCSDGARFKLVNGTVARS